MFTGVIAMTGADPDDAPTPPGSVPGVPAPLGGN
jgi:hypothetical protein